MLGLFLRPEFLFVAAALVSVPIIIHLINRMRFKRIRWAAMEFLLKAQKRTRRRLIIEQLILLALRCFLIALVGLLVARFIGCGDASTGGKPSLHIVLLDDTLSMQDTWVEVDGTKRNCFDVARTDVLEKRIAKGLLQSKTNDSLIILPLSKLSDPSFEVKDHTYTRLNNKEHHDKLVAVIKEMKPSQAHVHMSLGVKKVEEIVGNTGESAVTLYVVGDFRDKDWGRPAGEGLMKELVRLVKDKKSEVKLLVIDTVHKERTEKQSGYPPSRDNIGIVDVKPETRIAGKNAPIQFEVTIKNFSGKDIPCRLLVRDGATGTRIPDPDLYQNPLNPLKVKANAVTTVTFVHKFNPNAKINPTPFEHLTVSLVNDQLGDLANDGLDKDNTRHVMVEVQDKVPILIIDGERAKGREKGKDSFHIEEALEASKGRYQVEFGHVIAPGIKPALALEKVDLRRYAAIFLLNVPNFDPKQVEALKNYVHDGGGVGFFMGPLVMADHYNKVLYDEGKGVFPAPLAKVPYPPLSEPSLEPKEPDETPQFLIRDDKFQDDPKKVPIFRQIPIDRGLRDFFLRYLPIRRYYPVDRNLWKQDPDKVFELATLPNDKQAKDFYPAIEAVIKGERAKSILQDASYAKFHARIRKHMNAIVELGRPTSDAKGYELAQAVDRFFNEKGDDKVKDHMPDFWALSDQSVQKLRTDLINLREQVRFGDAFIVARHFGKGKTFAVMCTAGKDWSDFPGGCLAELIYPPFIGQATRWLSSAGTEVNMTVGTHLPLTIDVEKYKGATLTLNRYFVKTEKDRPQQRVEPPFKQPGRADGANKLTFDLMRHHEPGLYVSELVDNSNPEKPLARFGHVFNVDTEKEGDLRRLSTDDLNNDLISKVGDKGRIGSPSTADDVLFGKTNDFSESPWLFLLFLLVLVAEQALAVHLSFHLKPDDQEVQSARLTP